MIPHTYIDTGSEGEKRILELIQKNYLIIFLSFCFYKVPRLN